MLREGCADAGQVRGRYPTFAPSATTWASPLVPGARCRNFIVQDGPLSIGDACSLHELKDAVVMAREGEMSLLRKFVLPVEAALLPLPRVIIRDTAVDAICHGASLACPVYSPVKASSGKAGWWR